MRIKIFFSATLLSIALFQLSGCGRTPEYQYKLDDSYLAYNQQHSIKELVSGSADILWVIDNSGSMETYQQEVALNMNTFIQEFYKQAKNADWKMGLLSTDEFDQPYIGFTPTTLLDSSSVDPISLFNNSIRRLGTSGSGTEKSFTPIMNAINRFPTFLRSNAKLFVIIVSDEVEQSLVSAPDFINFLVQKKGSIKNILAFGIHEMPNLFCGNNAYQGEKYEAFINATKGTAYSICSPDYGKILGAIGANIGREISYSKIILRSRPDLSTLKVLYRGQELPKGPKSQGGIWVYDYDENAILFHDLNFANSDQESVRVVYEYKK